MKLMETGNVMNNMNLFDILKSRGQLKNIFVYSAITTETDPTEHTTVDTLLEPVIVKGAISEIGTGSLKYKYYGELKAGSKQIICEKKYLNLLKICKKITIDSEDYTVYQDADKGFTIKENQDYLVCILSRK